MTVLRGGVSLFTAKILGAVAMFAGTAYFANVLSSSVLGVFFLFEALLGMGSIISDGGYSEAAQKRISGGGEPSKVASTALLIKAGLFVISTLVILILRDTINSFLGAPLAVFLVVGLFVHEIMHFYVNVIRGEKRVEDTAIVDFIRRGAWVTVGVGLVQVWANTESLIISLLVGYSLAAILAFWRADTQFNTPSIEYAKSLTEYARHNLISRLGGFAFSWFDIILIGLWLGPSLVSSYEVAWRIAVVVMLFSRSIASAVLPEVSQLHGEGNIEGVSQLVQNALEWATVIAIPALFGGLVLHDEIITIIFGEEYSVAGVALIILLAESIFQSLQIILARVLQGMNKPRLSARSTVITILLNICLNALLIPILGITGAAIGTSVSFSLNCLIHYYYAKQFVALKIPIIRFLRYTTGSAAMAGLLILVKLEFGIEGYLDLSLAVLLGVVVYSASLMAQPEIRKDIYLLVARVR